MRPEERIYFAYFTSKKKQLYFNEIKALTKLSDSSLSRTLKGLIKKMILFRTETKSNTYYIIKDQKFFAIRFAEFSYNQFKSLNNGVKIPLQEFLMHINYSYCCVVFGSAANREEKKGSDIDVLIVTDNQSDITKAKRKSESVSNYPLNIFVCNVEEFRNSQDHIISQARSSGFPFSGEQNFYEVILIGH